MTSPSLLVDVFTGLSLAMNLISTMFLVFLGRRYTEREITRPLRWLVWGTVSSGMSIVLVWFTEREYTVSTAVAWVIGATIALNICIIFWQWRHLKKLKNHPHLAKLNYVLPWVVGFGAVAFGLQVYDMAVNGGPLFLDFMRGTAGVISVLLLSFGTYRARAQYPGSGYEALIILGGVAALVVAVVMVATTNTRAERAVVNNQSAIVAHLIQRQAIQHLTEDSFDPKTPGSKAQLTKFIEEVSLPELHRIKIIRTDGLVLASDLEKLTGTTIPLTGSLGEAMRGQESTTLVESPADLPETERQFGSLRLVTVPLTTGAGTPVRGAAQLFFDAPAAMASIQALNDAINFGGLISILTIVVILTFLLRIFRRNVSHPFAEILDEIKDIHVKTDSGEHRRLTTTHHSDFTQVAQAINRLINEYEETIRELKKKLQEKGGRE